MPVDNTLYNRPGDIWWDEHEPLSTLRTMVNPGRFPYFCEVLTERLGIDPRGTAALDVGCGGGLLAEEFARLGCAVTGIDPSEPSLATARAHAARSGLTIDYQVGVGEALPCEDASFDIVYCCDVLEHVNDLNRVIAEIARVLKPAGVFLYDTINRTLLSKLVVIKLAQEWPATRFVPANLHDWSMFITPGELQRVMARHGLQQCEVVGLTPPLNPVAIVRAVRLFKRGAISYGELGRRLAFRRSRLRSGSYMGYAVKALQAISRPKRPAAP